MARVDSVARAIGRRGNAGVKGERPEYWSAIEKLGFRGLRGTS